MSNIVRLMQLGAGGAGGVSPGSYFILTRNTTSPWNDAEELQGIATDSQNNVYTLFGIAANSQYNGALVKTDKDGNIEWTTGLSVGASGGDYYLGVVIDSYDRPHVLGTVSGLGANGYLHMFNPTNGAILDTLSSFLDDDYSDSNGHQFNDNATSISIINDQIVFGCLARNSYQNNRPDLFTVTVGANGYTGISGARRIGDNISAAVGLPGVRGIHTYYEGAVERKVVMGHSYVNNTFESFIMHLTVQPENLVSGRNFEPPSYTNLNYVDASGNMYFAFSHVYETDITVLKYSQDGTLLWERRLQRNLSYINRIFQLGAITTDIDGNVYVYFTCESVINNNWDGCVVKLDSSGTLDWVNGIRVSGDSYVKRIHTDLTGSVYLGTGGGGTPGMIKIPNTGDVTGSYTVGSVTFVIDANPWVTASTTSNYGSMQNSLVSLGSNFISPGSGQSGSTKSLGNPLSSTIS